MNNKPKDKRPMNSGLFFVLSFLCMAVPLAISVLASRQGLPPLHPPLGDHPPLDVGAFADGIWLVVVGMACVGVALSAGMLTLVRALIIKASTPKFKDNE